jgi:hypothetical protein
LESRALVLVLRLSHFSAAPLVPLSDLFTETFVSLIGLNEYQRAAMVALPVTWLEIKLVLRIEASGIEPGDVALFSIPPVT